MNIQWCRNEAERLWWLHRENAMWFDELRATLLVATTLLRSSLRKQDPNSQKFNEANELNELGTAKSIANFKQLKNAILYFEKKSLQEICKNYIEKKSGATNHILQNI